MLKKLPLVISIASALSLAGVTIYQSGVVASLRQELSKTFLKLTKTEQALDEEMAKNEHLEQEIAILKDSISLLNTHIEDLKGKISELKKTVDKLNQTIQKQADQVESLTAEINHLRKKNVGNENKIKNLEATRDSLLVEMKKLDDLRTMAKLEKTDAEKQNQNKTLHRDNLENRMRQREEVQDQNSSASETRINQSPGSLQAPGSVSEETSSRIKMSRQKKMADILANTTVRFQNIRLRKEEEGQDLKKIKANGWRYTLMNVELENPNREVLEGEEFLIQVYDLDNQQVVPVNERNPGFPGSELGNIGHIFKYTGQPLAINYFNSQKKEGSNYEIRLFYFKDKVVYPLRNGIVRIVKNDDVVAML